MVSLGTNQLFILIFFAQASSTQKECYRLNQRGGYDPFCCNNHVRINDACVECKPGTSSQNEKPCKPCNGGRYGINCDHNCNCKMNEKCDSEDGCKLRDDLFRTGLKHSTLISTVESIGNVSYTSPNRRQSTVSLYESTSSKGLSTREVLVYSLGSAAFGIVCTFMCVAFICFHRCKTKQLIENSTINSENQVNDDTKSCYSLYESIDEDAIYDDNILEIDSEYSADYYCKTESEVSTLNSEKSGYLLPFTAVIPHRGQDEHLYCTDVRSVTGSSVSSMRDHKGNDSKPINQYEQLQIELSKQSKSEYTNLEAVYYLELINIRKSYSNNSFTETVQNCCDSTVSTLMNTFRKIRKCYSNNDIPGQEILSECITSKNKTENRRCYSE